jgi:hypothetical protein
VDLDDSVQQYPDFQLEDELLLQGGRDVMYLADARETGELVEKQSS